MRRSNWLILAAFATAGLVLALGTPSQAADLMRQTDIGRAATEAGLMRQTDIGRAATEAGLMRQTDIGRAATEAGLMRQTDIGRAAGRAQTRYNLGQAYARARTSQSMKRYEIAKNVKTAQMGKRYEIAKNMKIAQMGNSRPYPPPPKPHSWHPHPVPHWPTPRPMVEVRTPVYPAVYQSPVTTYAAAPSNPAPAIIPVAVLNPADTGATLCFTIGGTRYDLPPGLRQDFQLAGTRTIQFDRGGSFGTASYSLSEGLYTFKATDAGWDLERLPYQPADSQ
jgi:hypothetical protein